MKTKLDNAFVGTGVLMLFIAVLASGYAAWFMAAEMTVAKGFTAVLWVVVGWILIMVGKD